MNGGERYAAHNSQTAGEREEKNRNHNLENKTAAPLARSRQLLQKTK